MGYADRPGLHHAVSLDARPRRLCLALAVGPKRDANSYADRYSHGNANRDTVADSNAHADRITYSDANAHTNADADCHSNGDSSR